jgi:hypothetical protein
MIIFYIRMSILVIIAIIMFVWLYFQDRKIEQSFNKNLKEISDLFDRANNEEKIKIISELKRIFNK